MKISSIKAIPWSPDQTPDSYGVLASRNFVAVKVETDEGITGWGDATVGPLSVANMVEELGDIIWVRTQPGLTITGKDFITSIMFKVGQSSFLQSPV